MSEEEYTRKLKSMQQYIPFLEVMIAQLKDPKKKNREQQLQKMESLYAMITDTKRKLKYETLVKCEDVIKKIQEKVNPTPLLTKTLPNRTDMQKYVCKDPPEQTLLNVDKVRDEKFKLELARAKLQDLTPASPSPPRELNPTVTITERVDRRRDRLDIYSAAGANLQKAKEGGIKKSVFERIGTRLPDLSKPPLSQEDLKLLDVPDGVIDTDSVTSKSLDELENIREKLYRELDETKESLKSKKQLKLVPTTQSPVIGTKTKPGRVEKVIKEPDSIFGSILSSLDGKIIEHGVKKEKKPVKKDKDKSDKDHKVHKSPNDTTEKEHKSTTVSTVIDKEHKIVDKELKIVKEPKSTDKKHKSPDKDKSKHKEDKHNKDKEKKTKTAEVKLEPKRLQEVLSPDNKPDKIVEPTKILQTKETDAIANKNTECGSSFKRLADKYNPKPRKHSIEEDVEKQIEEKIMSSKQPPVQDTKSSSFLRPTETKWFEEPDPMDIRPPTSWFEPPKEQPKWFQDAPCQDVVQKNVWKPPMPDGLLPKSIIPPAVNNAVNQLLNTLKPVNTTNMPVRDPFLNSPTGPFMQQPNHTNNIFPNQTMLLQQNQLLHKSGTNQSLMNQPLINQPLMNQPLINQSMMNQPLMNTSMMNQPIMSQQFGQSQNQFVARNQMMNHSTNIGGNTFVNNYIVQQQSSNNANQFFQTKKSFNPYTPIGECSQSSDEYDPKGGEYYQQNTNEFPVPMISPPIGGGGSGGVGGSSRFEQQRGRGGFNANLNRNKPFGGRGRFQNCEEQQRKNRFGDIDDRATYPRASGDDRDPRKRPRGESRDPRLSSNRRSIEYRDDMTKFDKTYAKLDQNKDSFTSPLDSLYNSTGTETHGKGYGVQKFKIPKINKKPDCKIEEKAIAEVVPSSRVVVNLERVEATEKKGDTPPKVDVKNDDRDPKLEEEKKPVVKEEEKVKVEDKIEDEKKVDEEKTVVEEKKPPPTEDDILKELVKNIIDRAPDQKEMLYNIINTLTGHHHHKKKKKFKKIRPVVDSDSSSSDNSSSSASEEEVEVKEVVKHKSTKKSTRSPKKDEIPAKKTPTKASPPKTKEEVVVVDGSESESTPTPVPVASSRPKRSSSQKKSAPAGETANERVDDAVDEKVDEFAGEKVDETVVESVGERIKNRKRVSSPQTPKKTKPRRYKSELDLLHEDIKEMFIRDGVLTATGKRMCRILKDNPEALTSPSSQKQQRGQKSSAATNEDGFEADDDLPLVSRLRSSADRSNSPKTRAATANLRVLIEKSVDIDEMTAKKASKLYESPATESHDDDTSDDRAFGTTTETDTTIDSVLASPKTPKMASKKKKPRSSWSMGMIRKKKKSQKNRSETTSGTNSPIPHDDTSSVTSEVETIASEVSTVSDEPKEAAATNLHDRNYYWYSNEKLNCKLCPFKGKPIIQHYRSAHPQDEVTISRMRPDISLRAIKDSLEEYTDSGESLKHRYSYECQFCDMYFESTTAENFHDHVASHTGEFRYRCRYCRFISASSKSLRTHLHGVHNSYYKNNTSSWLSLCEASHPIPHGNRFVVGYICVECHYVQMDRTHLESHVRVYHQGGGDEIIVKINMSKTVPQIVGGTSKPEKAATPKERAHMEEPAPPQQVMGVSDEPGVVKETQKPPRKKPGPKPKAKKTPPKKTSKTKSVAAAKTIITEEKDINPKEGGAQVLLKETETNEMVTDNVEGDDGVTKITETNDGLNEMNQRKAVALSETPDQTEACGGNKKGALLLGDDSIKGALQSYREDSGEGKISSSTVTDGDNNKTNNDGIKKGDDSNMMGGDGNNIGANSDGISSDDDNMGGDYDNMGGDSDDIGDDKIIGGDNQNRNESNLTGGDNNKMGVTADLKSVSANNENETSSKQHEKELNVFTSETDLNEENQKIEEERREKMQEIYDSIKRHQSSFIEQLKTKLDNQKNETEVIDGGNGNSNNKEQESEITSTVPELCKKAAVRALDFDDTAAEGVANNEGGDIDRRVPNKMVHGMGSIIERLQEQLTAAPKLSPFEESNSLMPPPLAPIKDFAEGKMDVINAGPIVIRTIDDTIEYICFLQGCTFVGYSEDRLESHIINDHSNISHHCDQYCPICFKEVPKIEKRTSILDLLKHVIANHVKVKPTGGVPLLRMRRMSGDILSMDASTKKNIKQEVIDDVESDCAFAKEPPESEGLIIPSEESFPFSIQSVESQPSEDSFPFSIQSIESQAEFPLPIISNVVSLAENPEDDLISSMEPSRNQPPPLRPITSNPQFIRLDSLGSAGPVNLMIAPDSPTRSNLFIVNPPPQQPTTPNQRGKTKKVLLKDFPLTIDDLKKPKKSPEASAALNATKNLLNLYKCPVYECKYSTNARMMFENHLTLQHTNMRDEFLPCLYCNFKTEFGHVVIHVDVRHGSCRYACAYCVYRASCQGYVEVHQDVSHADKPVKVLMLPVHKDSMSSKGIVAKAKLKDFIVPFKCGQKGCKKVYLTNRDFMSHLETHSASELICSICGYKTLMVDTLLRHSADMHGLYYYNCAYCKMGANTHSSIFRHLALHHYSSPPDVVLRTFTRKHLVLESVVLDHDYEQLTHNMADLKRHQSVVYVHNLPGNQESQVMSPFPTGYVSVLKSSSGAKEAKKTQKEPLVLNSLLKGSLHDEPLLEILQKTSSSKGQPEEEDPLKLDDEQQVQVEAEAAAVTPSVVPMEVPHVMIPSNFAFMDESDSLDVDFERCGDDVEDEPDGLKVSLSGHDLYKCVSCASTMPNSAKFKSHLNKCASVAATNDPKPYACAHCVKTFKNVTSLADHIRIHGIGKFRCSLCDFQHPYHYQVRSHMKARHKIMSTVATPVDKTKTDVDRDDFVVKPKSFKRKSVDSASAAAAAREAAEDSKLELGKLSKITFGPDEIDQLPRRPIFSCQVKCAKCGYATKVRTNLVRHLEFHVKEVEVPSTAPVNPVPCLEKNEKMFDKMTNLAISSMGIGGRMGGIKAETAERAGLTKEEEALLPAFVPSTKRFVCGITACNYLCHEESRLRHHLLALHADETTYTCTHCKRVLNWEKGAMNVDHVTKHMRLHDLNLYKCAYCEFAHNLKHKVERHVGDRHADRKLNVIVVREMSPEVDSNAAPTENNLISLTAKEAKVWRCGMCKFRSASMEDVRTHCVHKHDIDSQYKCALCNYKSNAKETFAAHFEDEHKGCAVDIIDVFLNTTETATTSKSEISESDLFDTTPLWQRDRPRVRHIRGILLEDAPKAKKSKMTVQSDEDDKPKQPAKTPVKAAPKDVSFVDIIDELNSAIKEITQTIVIDDDDESSSGAAAAAVAKKKRKMCGPKAKHKAEDKGMGTYGPYGTPLNDMFLCPLCDKFNTQYESDITHHLFQELEYFRHKCTVCGLTGITFSFVCDHASKKHKQWDPKSIVELPKNEQIEQWVEQVLKVQRGKMKGESSGCSDSDSAKKGSQKFVEYETVVLGGEDDDEEAVEDAPYTDALFCDEKLDVSTSSNSNDGVASPDVKKQPRTCQHCNYMCKNVSDMRKHEMRHWAQKPLKCGHCNYEGVTSTEITQHSRRAHRDLEPIVINLPTPSTPVIVPISRKRRPPLLKPQPEKASTAAEDAAPPPPLSPPANKPPALPKSGIVVKPPVSDTIFVCKYCPKRSDTVIELKAHWQNVHKNYTFQYKVRERSYFEKERRNIPAKCIFCNFIGTVDEMKKHYDSNHADSKHLLHYKCSDCTEYFFRIDHLKGHFYEMHPDQPFTVSNCKNTTRKPEPPDDNTTTVLKKFKCSEDDCHHTSNSYKAIKDHLRSHAKPYKCSYCEQRFNYPSLVQKHQQFSHTGFEFKCETLNESFKLNELLRRKLLVLNQHGEYEVMNVRPGRKRKRSADKDSDEDELLVVKRTVYTARKKTGPKIKKATARKSTTHTPAIADEGYSWYGIKPDNTDLKKLTTTISIGGNDIVTTIEQFSHISNLFPVVMLTDCSKHDGLV